jgi:IclR family acetate operon transcriptional repressor
MNGRSNSLIDTARFSSSVIYGLRALEAVVFGAGREGGVTVATVAQQLGLRRGKAYRLIRTLEAAGYVRRNGDRQYVPAGKVVELSARVLDGMELRALADPVMVELMEECSEAVHLGVLRGATVMYVHKIDAPHVLRMHTQVGSLMPAHSTALGKAILAFSPKEVVDELLSHPLVARTPATVTSPPSLREELEGVRARGYAVDNIENEPDIRCVGAPVFDHTGGVVAAVSVSAPVTRFSSELIELNGIRVAAAAQRLSRLLGAGDAPRTTSAVATPFVAPEKEEPSDGT